jgi:single-stranded-DNA-specific exonuclease
LSGLDLRPHLDIDAEVPLSVFAGDTFQSLQQLAPFGCSNQVPTFLSRNVKTIEVRNLGNQGEHLWLKLRQGDATWQAIGFRLGNLAPQLGSSLDIVYNLEIDRWNNEETLRLNLLDLALSA